MDGKKRKDFDIIDHFIINHALDLKQAKRAMRMDSSNWHAWSLISMWTGKRSCVS